MTWILYDYPKCSTVKKAKAWLDKKGIAYTTRHIVDENPTAAEIEELHLKSGLEIKRFFNTSGKKYRELGLKDTIKTMSPDEMYATLATDGMLVKRPILTDGQRVLVGFKEAQWEEVLGGKDAR